jgi:hypothetical protein
MTDMHGDVRILCENGVMLDKPRIEAANLSAMPITLNRWERTKTPGMAIDVRAK